MTPEELLAATKAILDSGMEPAAKSAAIARLHAAPVVPSETPEERRKRLTRERVQRHRGRYTSVTDGSPSSDCNAPSVTGGPPSAAVSRARSQREISPLQAEKTGEEREEQISSGGAPPRPSHLPPPVPSVTPPSVTPSSGWDLAGPTGLDDELPMPTGDAPPLAPAAPTSAPQTLLAPTPPGTTKRRAKAPPKADVDVRTLSALERAVHAAIVDDPDLSRIVPRPAQTARDLVQSAPDVNVAIEVRSLGAWYRASGARYTQGATFLLRNIARKQRDALNRPPPRRDPPPTATPRSSKPEPPRWMQITDEDLAKLGGPVEPKAIGRMPSGPVVVDGDFAEGLRREGIDPEYVAEQVRRAGGER